MNRVSTKRSGVVAFAVVALLAAGCGSSSNPTTSPSTTRPATGNAPSPLPTRVDTIPTATSTSTVPAVACSRPHPGGQTAETFTFQGMARTYQLYVPRKYTGTENVPVVFDFHGFGSNAVEQMVYGKYTPEADRDDFLIVAPDGQVPDNRHFNLTSEKGLQNDVQMVGALLDHIEATLCVDRTRVYATGMSDGGAMTSALACTMSNRFAAFGAVAVIIACGGTRSVPIMAFSGTADPVVPFNGGKVSCCGGASLGSAPAAMARWAEHDHCAKNFTEVRLGTEVRRRTWSGCDPGSAAVFYIIDGGGHTWPGSIHIDRLGKTTDQIDASATIWKFFQAHTLPA